MDRIKNMLINEDYILDNLRAGLKEEEDFKAFYTTRIDKVRSANLTVILDELKHPNTVYNMMTSYANEYNKVRDLVYLKGEKDKENAQPDDKEEQAKNRRLTEFLWEQLSKFADNTDIVEARMALVRLQQVYKLHPADMVKGNYRGVMGPKLDAVEAFLIGWTAFQDGRNKAAMPWFKVALSACKLGGGGAGDTSSGYKSVQDVSRHHDMDQVLQLEGGITEITIKALMARAMIRTGLVSQARTQLTELQYRVGGPENAEVMQLAMEIEDPRLPKMEDKGSSDDDKKVSELCMAQNKTNTRTENPDLFCRYKSLYLPYFRFGEEILNWAPYVSVFHNVITDQETRLITSLAKQKLYRGHVVGQGGHQHANVRTSHLTFLEDYEAPVVNWVSGRVGKLVNLDMFVNYKKTRWHQSSAEPMQVVNYGLGGHYGMHVDPIVFDTQDTEHVVYGSGDRLATFLLYLSDVDMGGSTIFPKLDLAVAPIKNSALFWYSYTTDGKVDDNTVHAACPVLIGEKWVSNKWILNHGNFHHRRCGLTQRDTQRDIDDWMVRDWKPTEAMLEKLAEVRKKIPMSRAQRRSHLLQRAADRVGRH